MDGLTYFLSPLLTCGPPPEVLTQVSGVSLGGSYGNVRVAPVHLVMRMSVNLTLLKPQRIAPLLWRDQETDSNTRSSPKQTE